MFVSIANAAGVAPAEGGAQGGTASFIIMMVVMFAVFYFIIVRPQQKRAKAQKEMLGKLGRGDHVVTSGGLLGRIVDVDRDILILDLGETKVRVPRAYVNGTYDPKSLEVSGDNPNQAK